MELTLQTKKRILGGVIATILVGGLIIGIFFLVRCMGNKTEWTLDDLKKEKNIFVVDILFTKEDKDAGKEDLISKYLQFESNDGNKLSFHVFHLYDKMHETCRQKDETMDTSEQTQVTLLDVTVDGLSGDKPKEKLSLGSEYPGVPSVEKDKFKVKFKEMMKKADLVDKLLKSIEKNAEKLPALGRGSGMNVLYFDWIAEILEKQVQDLEWVKEAKPSEGLLARKEKDLRKLKREAVPGDLTPKIDDLERQIRDIKKKLGK